jgi:hypothetical protein
MKELPGWPYPSNAGRGGGVRGVSKVCNLQDLHVARVAWLYGATLMDSGGDPLASGATFKSRGREGKGTNVRSPML